jgi:hypothetical protein
MFDMYLIPQSPLNALNDASHPFKTFNRLALASALPMCCFILNLFELFDLFIILGGNSSLKSAESSVVYRSKIHVEKIYNVVVKVLRLENSSG